MRLLDRYITAHYLRALLGVGFIISVVMLISIVLGHVDDVLENGAALGESVRWFMAMLPLKIVQTMPMVILLSVLFAVGTLSRHNEIIAIISTGVSRDRIFLPILVVTALLSAATLWFNEAVVPRAARAAELIERVEIEGQAPPSDARETLMPGTDRTFYWMQGYFDYANRPRMVRPSVLVLSEDGSQIVEWIEASTATHVRPMRQGREPHWIFTGGAHRRFDGNGELESVDIFRERQISLEEELTEFLSVENDPESLNFIELRRYIDVTSARPGVDLDRYRTEMHIKLAFPLSLIVISMLAFPFAMKTRAGTLFVGFSLAIIWIVLFYAFVGILRSLGNEGHLWPWMAAWAPNAVFLVAAGYFMELWRT